MSAIAITSLIIAVITFVITLIVYICKRVAWKKRAKENEKAPGADSLIGAPILLFMASFMIIMLASAIAGNLSETNIVSTETKEIVLNESGYPIMTNYVRYADDIFGFKTDTIAKVDVLDKETRTMVNIRISDRSDIIFTEDPEAFYEKHTMEYSDKLMRLFAIYEPNDEYTLYLPSSVTEEFHIDENVKVFLEGE